MPCAGWGIESSASMQYSQPLIFPSKRQRPNCLKPLVGCTLGPVLLFTCMLSCVCAVLTSLSLTSPAPIFTNFTPDPTQAAAYPTSIHTSLQSANSGTFTIAIAQENFSSWLNYEYQSLFEKYEITGSEHWHRVEPVFQARFENQEIELYIGIDWAVFTLGNIITAELSAPTSDLSPNLVEVEITSLKIGGLDTDSSQKSLETWIEEILTDPINDFVQSAAIRSIQIEDITIDEGILTLSGTLEQ